MPSSLPAIFTLPLVISGCAALQVLQSVTGISIQLRLGIREAEEGCDWVKMQVPYVRADPLIQLLLCPETERINPDIFSAIVLWK